MCATVRPRRLVEWQVLMLLVLVVSWAGREGRVRLHAVPLRELYVIIVPCKHLLKVVGVRPHRLRLPLLRLLVLAIACCRPIPPNRLRSRRVDGVMSRVVIRAAKELGRANHRSRRVSRLERFREQLELRVLRRQLHLEGHPLCRLRRPPTCSGSP